MSNHNRTLFKQDRLKRRDNLNQATPEISRNQSSGRRTELNKLSKIRANHINVLKNQYKSSRNMEDTIYRSETGDLSLNKFASVQKPLENNERTTANYTKISVRKEKRNKQRSEKKSMLFSILPSYIMGMGTSQAQTTSSRPRNNEGVFKRQKTYNISTKASKKANMIFNNKILRTRYKSRKKANNSITSVDPQNTLAISNPAEEEKIQTLSEEPSSHTTGSGSGLLYKPAFT